jgi:hypothetical protein
VCTRTRDVKRQINPSMNAYVLRSALILLSLVTFNQDIFCQTPTPSPTPTATAECFRPPPGACASYEAESPICPPNPQAGDRCNILQGSAFVLSCPTCSGGAKVSYVGSNSGTLQFNGVGVVVPGAHTLTICYLNGDAVRYALLSVNGGPGMPLSFPSTGSFQTLGSIQITVTLNTGCNTLEFYNPIVGDWAPDFDRIQFNCPTCAPASCDTGIIQNGGFETGSFPPWISDNSNPTPFITATASHSGAQSAVVGGATGGNPICGIGSEPQGDSSFYQQFTVPPGQSTLSFYHKDCTTDTITFDWQDAYITNTSGQILQTIFHVCDAVDWTNTRVDMTPYAGQTVRIKFLVHQDAFGDLTAMYVDDVVLSHPCGTPSPTPTLTPTPTPTPTPTISGRAAVADFNGDGHPDWVLRNAGSRQTAIWYLNNNVFIGGAFGPTLAAGWGLRGAADFNRDGHPDYPLFAPSTRQTGIWYLSGPTLTGTAYGPTLPSGWALVTTADFNADAKPDYVLYNAGTRQTAIWYMNNNVFMSGAFGPTLPAGWSLRGVADFNRDGHPDYALLNSTTGQTAIWYLSGPTFIAGAFGPTVPTGWALVATADFNGDLKPDYLLYNAGTRQTAIWYMNNNVFIGGAFGPTLPAGWSLVGQ